MPISEAQKRAAKKYLMSLDEIRIRVEKGEKEKIRAAAEQHGMSLNAFVVEAIAEKIARNEE